MKVDGDGRSKKTAYAWRIKGDLWLLPNEGDAEVFYSRTFIHSRKRTSRSSRITLTRLRLRSNAEASGSGWSTRSVTAFSARKWKQGAAHEGDRPTAAPGDVREPGLQPTDYAALYNGMIAPFAPYSVRGAIWYQGESNAGGPERYQEFMPMLIKDWQATFERDEFPFGIVQLAAFMAERDDLPAEGNWALLREAQSMTARDLPNVGIVITTDIGDARDIHPRNKREVVRRLGLWALAEAYDRPIDGYESPSFQKVEKVNGPAGGKALRITFTQTGTALKTRDGKEVGGFALSGPNGRFQWADAKIEEGGRSVVVWSSEVSDPTEVCFAWQNNPVRANLVNSEGLPADPFKADSESNQP